jgi:hypothetical protein
MQELSRGYLRLDFLKTMIFPEIANQMAQIRISKKKKQASRKFPFLRAELSTSQLYHYQFPKTSHHTSKIMAPTLR